MDKKLLKAYIRTIVEEEVERLLPKMLSEAVHEIKAAQGASKSVVTESAKPPIDRKRLAELMGIDYNRESGTLSATTAGLPNAGLPMNVSADVDPGVRDALTRDYSALMKAMKLT
jgi:hypothetical protein